MRKAAVSCWNLVSPLAAGIGLASAAVSFLIGLYYNTMVAWTLIYAWKAITSQLPRAADEQPNEQCDGQSNSNNETTTTTTTMSGECQLASAYEFQWYRETLDVTNEVGDWSHFNWPVALCLTLAWLISYLCLVRGLSSSKRLVYTISIFPYVILVIFFLKAFQLEGMEHGVRYLFAPDVSVLTLYYYNTHLPLLCHLCMLCVVLYVMLYANHLKRSPHQWPKLLDPFVWLQAAAQVFFSLGLGFGGLIALSSYNSINNNCYRDAVKVSIINFATSLLAGVVIFSILGFRAQLNHSKCQMERDQQIDFYLADYNLKVLDYGAVFKQVHSETATTTTNQRIARSLDKLLAQQEKTTTTTTSPPKSKKKKSKKRTKVVEEEAKKPSSKPVTQFVASRQVVHDKTKKQNETSDKFDSTGKLNNNNNEQLDDEFSAADAIDSITNLDRQLDLGSPSGSFDYGDADSEFILNASALITSQQLELIIEGIKGLPKCSIERELDESTRGTGLVFVVIAEAIGQFDSIASATESHLSRKVNPFHLSASTWAILFFLMILALGFDSQFGNLEGLLSSLTDLNYFNLNKRTATAIDGGQSNGLQHSENNNNHTNGLQHLDETTGNESPPPPSAFLPSAEIVAVRRWATGVICLCSLIISLVFFAHGAGAYMFAIFDEYASNFSLILIALFELLTISYIYPLGRFVNDCELMTGKRPHFLILLSWRYISPILLLIILITTIKQFTMELDYEVWSSSSHLSEKAWPTWAIIFGSVLIICCVIWIPLVAMLKIILKVTLVPEEQSRQWFPAEELKEFHQLAESHDDGHQVTRLERILFGFREDYD